ncbi:MAG TPA: fused MFS/spermidine synthase [Solirubrobacterales bacterium]|nr:fused MFS/spermidine synthase [Solirubrobacterales bacterium]
MSKPKRAQAEADPVPKPGEDLPTALPPPAAAALVFVAAGAVLMLEILAVRLLAPYVGLTLETTTSIIGAALAGIAAGAAVGGYFADRTDTRRLIVGLLIGGGLLTLLTVPAVRWLGPGARGDGDLAALGITLIALVPAAAVLSAVSPAVAHLQLHDLRASGTIVGRLSAWATAGALIGTFGTGFVIVPLMPVGAAVLVIGAGLILAGIILGSSSRVLSPAMIVGMVVAAGALGVLTGSSTSPCEEETEYHCVNVKSEPALSGYHLVLDGELNSYVDPEQPARLAYPYTHWMADAINSTSPLKAPLDVVFVGGGAFTLPRWLRATRPGSRARVLEVDGEVVEFVEERLGLDPWPRLSIAVGDARIGILDVPDNSADVVVGDAFSGLTVPWHLTTREWMAEVRRVLRPGGLYTLNMIDYKPLSLLKAEMATLLEAFADVRLVSFPDPEGRPAGGSAVLLASDRPLPAGAGSNAEGALTYEQGVVEEIAAGAEPLRDDYAPVDQLLTTTIG